MTKTPEVKEETPELISREEYIADIKTRWKLFVKEVNGHDTVQIKNTLKEVSEIKEKPKIIICGGSAYPRQIEFSYFREIDDSIGASDSLI